MENEISRCGRRCTDCGYYPADCRVCRNLSDMELLMGMLEGKDTAVTYKALQELERMSDETGLAYIYTEKFANMISSDKYHIRIRGV